MYGLISKLTTSPGKREEFIAILTAAVNHMPGCLSYIVAKDSIDENAVWVTEVWDSKASHDASLLLPSVKDAMTKGKPMITGFGQQIVTLPVGGYGLRSGELH
jgi:quinol monooxygenase YgiN